MNIFILNAGRCGSSTFVQACKHISNFSAAHESRSTLTGDLRLAYPDNHIEADNRLCWMLGRLDQKYGNDAYYVHLTRDRQASVESFVKRMDYGIMRAYREGILMGGQQQSALEIASDYMNTVSRNISLFLNGKDHIMMFNLENASSDFVDFWNWIGARGELDKALAAWQIRYNASV
ncbi:MAG: hypothetical protein B6D77_07805 [gamma proteobacterium symbiont of Ctena orbiculata]|nr:MAG: hypothetical protein B6D77_07805 [gamma proteobacterium symbiont of Ctena orbiculata]PVV17275.1 MAG: hypothetical protein B6D78_19115 [gamma proteobacterium symbiont of Ctena orbiculata]PVV26394.1 MAG: hypothetical protein B6D79_06420 [gamma proteobacterium symbiont of Ctena orbiculata]